MSKRITVTMRVTHRLRRLVANLGLVERLANAAAWQQPGLLLELRREEVEVGPADDGKSRASGHAHPRNTVGPIRLVTKGVGMTAYRTVEIDGREVFYREGGDANAPALLLLHGFPSSSAQYQSLIDRLQDRYRVLAPDYPGFGQSPALEGTTTFDRIADVIDKFTHSVGLERFSLYMFDFGAPVGFRIATLHPERVQTLVLQNGNAHEDGLGPNMQALKPYWQDRARHEGAMRDLLQLEATRSQYVEGVADESAVNPDLWELDQRYLELPGRDQVMLDLLYDYQSNVKLYPRWQQYMLVNQPPALLVWGRNDRFFPPRSADAYHHDLPQAERHFLDTGHFATATHSAEIAELIAEFLARHGPDDGGGGRAPSDRGVESVTAGDAG